MCVCSCLVPQRLMVSDLSLLSVGLAKRVGARLLLASTSEVYGGEWVGLPQATHSGPLGLPAPCLR